MTHTRVPGQAESVPRAGGGGTAISNPGLAAALESLWQSIESVPPEVMEDRRLRYESMMDTARRQFEADRRAAQPTEKRFARAWTKAQDGGPYEIARAVLGFLVPHHDGRSVERFKAMITRYGMETVQAEGQALAGELQRGSRRIVNPLSVLDYRCKRALMGMSN